MRTKARNYNMLPVVLNGDDVMSILGIGHSSMSALFQREDFPRLEILKRNLVLKKSFFEWLTNREG